MQSSKPKNIMHIFLVLVVRYQFDSKVGDGLGARQDITEKSTLIIINFTTRKGEVMKKFLISFMCLFMFFIYLNDKVGVTSTPIRGQFIYFNDYGVYTMTAEQAKAPTLSILVGAEREINDKTGQSKKTIQKIVVIPSAFTHHVAYGNYKYIEYRKERKK